MQMMEILADAAAPLYIKAVTRVTGTKGENKNANFKSLLFFFAEKVSGAAYLSPGTCETQHKRKESRDKNSAERQ